MGDKDTKIRIQPLLDDIAAQSMTSTEQQLRANLQDAGLNPDTEIQNLKSIASKAIEAYRRERFDALPDIVPEDPTAMRTLLDQLLALPNTPQEAFMLAFREDTGQSENDIRLLTENLLELLKKHYDS